MSTEVKDWIKSIEYPEIRALLDVWCKYADTFDDLYEKYSDTSKESFKTQIKELQNGNALSDAQNGAITKLYSFLHRYEREQNKQDKPNGMCKILFIFTHVKSVLRFHFFVLFFVELIN